jgi:MFS family permease
VRLRRVDPALLAIVGEGFFSRLSFGLISFALPLYAYRLGMSLTAIGFLASLNLAVAILLKPLAGAAADRFGLKLSLTVAIFLRSVVSLLLAFATVPWQLFATRSLHGVTIAIRDPAVNALIAEHGGKKAIASAFAWYQTAKSVAGALGKTAAGLLLALTASNFSLVFGIAFVLALLPIFLVSRYVREVEREPLDLDREQVPAPPAGEVDRVAAAPESQPPIFRFAGLGFLVSGTAYMLANLFPVLAVEYAGLSEAEAGLIYSLSAIVVLAGPGFGWLSDNVSRKLVLSLRSVANVLSSFLYLVAPSFAGMASGRVLDDLGKAAFRPAWGALMAQVSSFDRRRRARTMGYMSAGEDAGEMAGPIVAGLIWSMWGVPALLGVRIALAVVTELYTAVLTKSLDTLEDEPLPLRDLRPDTTPPERAVAPLVLRPDRDALTEARAVPARPLAALSDAELLARLEKLRRLFVDSRELDACLDELILRIELESMTGLDSPVVRPLGRAGRA